MITRDRITSINANAFRDTEKLDEEYKKLVDSGWFVKRTDYRSIIRHETGHVVENKYDLDGLEAVKKVTNVKSDIKALEIVNEKLSEYAFEVDKEIISESFSGAYSSGEKNEFALKILVPFGIINT